jgi:hypothetical protein
MGLFSSKSGSSGEGLAGSVPFDVWGQRGWHNVDVVGESHYTREIRALFPAQFGSTGREITVPVSVTHDGRNRHDPNAVQVSASTGLLGYLSRADAVRYVGVLASLQGRLRGSGGPTAIVTTPTRTTSSAQSVWTCPSRT